MSVLVRRITKGKWSDYCKNSSKDKGLICKLFHFPRYNAPADAITNCLKTSNNNLSMWLLPDEKSINDVLLALCTGAKSNGLGTIDFIRIDTDDLKIIGLNYEQSTEDADTAVTELKKLHYNVSGFNYRTLGLFQDIVVKCVKKDVVERKTESGLKPLVADAMKRGRINYMALSDDYKKYLKRTFPNEKSIPEVDEVQLVCPYCGGELIRQ